MPVSTAVLLDVDIALQFNADASPWICHPCKRAFKSQCSLARHAATGKAHAKYEFRCPGPATGPKCNAVYIRHSSFRRHLLMESAPCKDRICKDHGIPANLDGFIGVSNDYYRFPIEGSE